MLYGFRADKIIFDDITEEEMKIMATSKDIIMPWGKYKGRTVTQLPSDYLKWLAENSSDEVICEAADEEYRRRTDEHDHWYQR